MSLRELQSRLRETFDARIEALSAEQVDDAYAELSAETVEVTVPITSAELLAWAGREGRAARVLAATESEDETVRSVALVADAMLRRDGTTLDLSRQDRQGMMNVLLSAGVLTQEDAAELSAMGTSHRPAWPRLTKYQIRRAWSLS